MFSSDGEALIPGAILPNKKIKIKMKLWLRKGEKKNKVQERVISSVNNSSYLLWYGSS